MTPLDMAVCAMHKASMVSKIDSTVNGLEVEKSSLENSFGDYYNSPRKRY